MAQPHPQPALPPAQAYSPAQLSPSQLSPSPSPMMPQGFAEHPSKRQRISPAPPQQQQQQQHPGYANTQPFRVPSPHTQASPVSAKSPSHPTLPSGSMPVYHHSYTNGAMVPNLPQAMSPPQQQHHHQAHLPSHYPIAPAMSPPTQHGFPHTPGSAPQSAPTSAPHTPTAGHSYYNANFAPAPVHPATGTMGPPQKPPERPVREYQYDVDDSLAGTGIDLREEEQFQANYFAGNYRAEAKTGLPANAPGPASSLYGSGMANQPAQPGVSDDQSKVEADVAQRAWHEAARRLAITRTQEIKNPFLQGAIVHMKAERFAKEMGLGLNLDPKSATGWGKIRPEHEFPKPSVKVQTQVGPDGAMIVTSGSFIPEDCFLADQIALISVAAKQRIREALEDANQIAVMRQTSSHGAIPAEWADAGVSSTATGGDLGREGNLRAEQAKDTDNGKTKSLKRSAEVISSTANVMTQSLRGLARFERDEEETRLRKRQKREEAKRDPTGVIRAATAAPATPGGVAPEPEKAPTKKELKAKAAASKAAEASSTRSANATSMQFLFGKKKKNYSWMSGGGASGTSTPTRPGASTPAPGTPAATPGPVAPENQAFTSDGRYRPGAWREDGAQGKDIQLRDWVAALSRDGREAKSLLVAMDALDNPPKIAPERQSQALS